MDEAGLSGIDLYTAGKFMSTAPLPMAEVVIFCLTFTATEVASSVQSPSDSVLLRPWARYSRFPHKRIISKTHVLRYVISGHMTCTAEVLNLVLLYCAIPFNVIVYNKIQ